MYKFLFIVICLLCLNNCSFLYTFKEQSNTNSLNNTNILNKSFSPDKHLANKVNADNSYIDHLTPDEVLRLLNYPTLINNINNIEIWQYRSIFTLNIVWDKKSYIQNNLTQQKDSQNLNDKIEVSPSIIWLECLGDNKDKLNPQHCFLKLIKNK